MITIQPYPNEVYSFFAFLSFVLVSIPLPWHLEAWNTGTCCYMIWTALACLNQFVNSVVWHGNLNNPAPVWCDISTKLIVGTSVAIPACSLCINRRLYHIATANTVTISRAEKRRAIMVDLAICIGIPVLEMVLHYIPQGHRFDIFEDVGCYPSTYNTWVAFVLVWSWPLAIGCVSAVYCVLTLIAFNKRRMQFKELLSKNNNLNANRYFRLMCLAGIEIISTIPLSSWAMYLDAKTMGIQPWISWEDTHSNFSNVRLIPSLFWHQSNLMALSVELTRWFVVICAIVFFLFFGFADEAKKNYRAVASTVAKHVGYTSTGSSTLFSSMGSRTKGFGTSSNGNSATLPVFVRKETRRRRDSMDTFTDVSDFKDKSFDAGTSFGALSLNDVGGALADTKAESSTDSSSYIESPTDTLAPPPLPRRSSRRLSHAEEDDDLDNDIEISSLRFSITPPEPVHTRTPTGVRPRQDSADIV